MSRPPPNITMTAVPKVVWRRPLNIKMIRSHRGGKLTVGVAELATQNQFGFSCDFHRKGNTTI